MRHNADFVVSFDNEENYDLLEHNVSSFKDAETANLAVTRSDKEVEVRFEASDNPINSGGGCSVTSLGEIVPSISIKRLKHGHPMSSRLTLKALNSRFVHMY